MTRELAAELVGTALLLTVVVGSGIMADRLAGGNDAVALLANSLATGAGLYVLIAVLGPVSGAQINPAVSLLLALRGEQSWRVTASFSLVQVIGAGLGVVLAHAMFGEQLWQVASRARSGPAQWLSEVVATGGLLGIIVVLGKQRASALPQAIALYIMAAYWFTASTSFANPAVTLARALTDTFTGIAPTSVPGFLGGQLLATLLVAVVSGRGPSGRQPFPWRQGKG